MSEAMDHFGGGSGFPMWASRHIGIWPPAGPYLIPVLRDLEVEFLILPTHTEMPQGSILPEVKKASEGTFAPLAEPFPDHQHFSHVQYFL